MRGKFLVTLVGLLLVSACVPTDVSQLSTPTVTPNNPTPTPTVTSTLAPIPDGHSDGVDPVATKIPLPDGDPDGIDPAPTETATPMPEPPPPVDFDGAGMLQDRCTQCHRLSRITGASMRPEAWRSTVERMVGYGAVLNAEELEALVQYLAEMYP